jgi:hypothetical protein
MTFEDGVDELMVMIIGREAKPRIGRADKLRSAS